MYLLKTLVALLVYGALHSLMAAPWFKAVSTRVMGERAYLGSYRMLYSIVSVLTLLPVLALMAAQPGRTVWRVDGKAADIILVVRALGAIGLLIALLQIDLLRFLGIKDLIVYFRGGQLPLPSEALSTRGLYRLVRHPFYLFGLVVLWATPSMTEAALGFTIGSTIYLALGSILEERRMIRTFGAAYVEYRKTVPWLIPFVKMSTRQGNR
jgi:protein-S-isoprenylcysteine O-methyltransferase Ste14